MIEIMNKEEMFPPIVYKYRKWNNPFHRRVIENNEVYFSAPKDFDDPLDCNPPVIYPYGHELFIYILNFSYRYNRHFNYVEHVVFASEMYKRSPMAFPEELKEMTKKLDDEFNKRFGVLSLTVDNSNEFLWKNYSNNHEGFCVGFDTRKLFDCVRGGCGFVQYKKELPSIDFAKDSLDEKIIKTVYYKEKKWENENEYRFHKLWPIGESVNRHYKLPRETLVEVVIGANMPSGYKEELINIVKQKHPYARIKNEDGGC